jgi:hypothetical protein
VVYLAGRGHPVSTGSSPLDSSAHPGVNGVSQRGLRNVSFRLRNVSLELRNVSLVLRTVSLVLRNVSLELRNVSLVLRNAWNAWGAGVYMGGAQLATGVALAERAYEADHTDEQQQQQQSQVAPGLTQHSTMPVRHAAHTIRTVLN